MASRSARAPERYRRHYYVSDHALERFGKRFTCPREQKDWPLAGNNIGHVLDAATYDAVRSKFYEDVIDNDGHAIRVVALSQLLHVELWSIMRPNQPRRSDFDQAIVTVFDKELYDQWQANRWTVGKGFGTLEEKLKPALALLPQVSDTPIRSPAPPQTVEPVPVFEDPRLITWECGGKFESVKLEKAAALVHYQKLRNEPGIHELQLWKPVKTKVVIEEE